MSLIKVKVMVVTEKKITAGYAEVLFHLPSYRAVVSSRGRDIDEAHLLDDVQGEKKRIRKLLS